MSKPNLPASTFGFPQVRMRRLRAQPWLRDLVCEHRLNVKDLIWPVFVIEGKNQKEPIKSMPGVFRYSIDLLLKELQTAVDLHIPAIALFPVIFKDKKTPFGDEALNEENLLYRAIKSIKSEFENLGVITDVALDPYTSHGHDGIFENGKILNDDTVKVLAQQAILQAKSGADIVAPSDMMDGRIGAIRKALDYTGHEDVSILSYAAKYASAFYGPFRDAVQTGNLLKGDKKTYQMNPANKDESLREVALDIQEGADMIMVKPGLPYLDIIRNVKTAYAIPTFAYHVSGEYAMLKAAAQNGWLDYEVCLMETLTGFKRAGCDGILTYGAIDAARLLNKTL